MSEPTDLTRVPWRVGTKLGRSIYAVVDVRPDPVPGDCDDTSKLSDVCLGMLDTPELAAEAVAAHNARLFAWLNHPSQPEFPGRP